MAAEPKVRGPGHKPGGWPAALCALLLGVVAQASLAQQSEPPKHAQTCVACHGPGGNSVLPGFPSLAAQPKTFTENQLVLIRDGLREVPAMAGLMRDITDEEVIALARYFAAQKATPPSAAPDPAKFSAGADLAKRALCGTCHLGNYEGQSQVPRLANQQEAYLLATMKMYRDKPAPGRDTLMSGPLQGFKDSELEALAHHFAHHGK